MWNLTYQGSNLCLLHCPVVSLPLSLQESPHIFKYSYYIQIRMHVLYVTFCLYFHFFKLVYWVTELNWTEDNVEDFPGNTVDKNVPANVWCTGPIPSPGRCLRATTPRCHNYWAWALEPGSHNYWNPHTLESVLQNKRSHCNEKPIHCSCRYRKPAHSNKDSAKPK